MRYICGMQLRIPIFPRETLMISSVLGAYEKKGEVHYILNGLPIYSHNKEDLRCFRYITSNLIDKGLCRKVDIQRAFHVSEDSVSRAYKKYKAEGESGFFGLDARKGTAHKLVGSKLKRIQRKLDKGKSVNSIAKEEGISEGSIRYRIKTGDLKKN